MCTIIDAIIKKLKIAIYNYQYFNQLMKNFFTDSSSDKCHLPMQLLYSTARSEIVSRKVNLGVENNLKNDMKSVIYQQQFQTNPVLYQKYQKHLSSQKHTSYHVYFY